MSQLIDNLENKVFTAVETIKNLRDEVRDLKEERMMLENKLKELISKMEGLNKNFSNEAPAEAEEEPPPVQFSSSIY